MTVDSAAESRPSSEMIGSHPRLRAVVDIIRRVADKDTTVLISGESGTGKELVAQAIHRASTRFDRRFVPVNCGAIPEDLLESEMFGHERGAFTDAVAARPGRFRLADGGTIFLDEIGDMSPKLQVKLLRVLEAGSFESVGGITTQTVDVRIVAATNRSLEEAVSQRRFREDLFYRLSVVPIHLPALRERREDIPALVDHFLTQLHERKGLPRFAVTDEALSVLAVYPWPGNIRELRNLLEQLVVLGSEDRVIRAESLPPQILPLRRAARASTEAVAVALVMTDGDRQTQRSLGAGQTAWAPPWQFELEGVDFQREMATIEDRVIARALDLSGGNKKEAARLLNLNRTTLMEKLKRKRAGVSCLAPVHGLGAPAVVRGCPDGAGALAESVPGVLDSGP